MKDILLALFTRVMFGAHALIAIWRAYTEYNEVTMWLLLVPVGALILETLFTVGARGGEEYKWVSPCVILYLASVLPSVWFLEMKNFDRRQFRHICNDLHWGLTSLPGCLKVFRYAEVDDVNYVLSNVTLRKAACEIEYSKKQTAQENLTIVTTTMLAEVTTKEALEGAVGNVVQTLDEAKKVVDSLLENINFFNEQTWILVLHQLLLFFLIVGRWLLPTGEGISKDQLSQLLLVFIGVGADILEFVTETIKEIEVRCDRTLLIVIMAFWSWSTLQFSLVLTATKARRTRAVGIYEGEDENDSPVVVVEEADRPSACVAFLKNMEVWGIFSTLILQDGPFLGTRLYIMVGRGVVHQMIVFFTTKNALVVILQLYRLSIIAFHKPKEEEEDEDDLNVTALGALQGAMLGGLKSGGIDANGANLFGASSELEEKTFAPTEVYEVKETTTPTDDKEEEIQLNGVNENNSNIHRGIAFVKLPDVKYN
ncbi:transmembrane protein 26-like [Styela clava]|uniref:transmembrane protein 26-like n=1 Tax=Styela clava TaxID=7725 RepID=UPI001939C29B|nr:transmembrane protein 26-like [Styela clava]